MDRAQATELLDRLHAAQNEFYGGGSDARLQEILSPEIVWTIPGANSIAGVYRGLDGVFQYFARRRDLATGTFRMHRRSSLTPLAPARSTRGLTRGSGTPRSSSCWRRPAGSTRSACG